MSPFNILTNLLLQASQSVWIIALALAAQLTTFRLLRVTGKSFEVVTQGHEPFDFQNQLTVAQIYEQLPAYTPASKSLYTRFFLIDFFFPLFASCFLSLLWTLLFRTPVFPQGEALLQGNIPLLAFLPTLFDWGENICFLVIITGYPRRWQNLAVIGVGFKRLKLISLFGVLGSTMFLIVIAIIAWLITIL